MTSTLVIPNQSDEVFTSFVKPAGRVDPHSDSALGKNKVKVLFATRHFRLFVALSTFFARFTGWFFLTNSIARFSLAKLSALGCFHISKSYCNTMDVKRLERMRISAI